MATPQQPELRRSGDNALLPGGPADGVAASSKPEVGGDTGPVPEGNLPGHHPEEEQDKPDPDDFVAKARQVAARQSTPEPTPATHDEGGTSTHPLVAVAAVPCKIAIFPARVALGVLSRIRRLL